jgi:hypothetical protein
MIAFCLKATNLSPSYIEYPKQKPVSASYMLIQSGAE